MRNFLEDFFNLIKSRMFILGALFSILFLVLVFRLYKLQIVNGEDYLNTFTYRIKKTVELASPRGTIYDCNGVALAYDKVCYTVTIEDSTLESTNADTNSMISKLIDFTEKAGDKLSYDIPLALDDNGKLEFTGDTATVVRFKKDIYSTEELTDTEKNADAQTVYDYMCSKTMFNVDASYGMNKILKMLSVRYDVFLKRYEQYLSVTVVSDASDKLVAAIKENQDQLPGVSIEQGYTRVYADSKYFSAITGYIGNISEDELAKYKADGKTGYSQNDEIGKTGIESYYESTLKGTKGSQTLYVNNLGSVLETANTVDPVPGNDVYLSIDADYTKKAYDMIEERIAGILLAYMREDVDSSNNDDLYIPAFDFYYALIDNNVINLDHLSAKDATDNEKAFFQKYKDYESGVSNTISEAMNKKKSSLSGEKKAYIEMAYNLLTDDGVLCADKLDTDDETLASWKNGDISLYTMINYAINKGVIDLSYLNVSSEYLGTDEIYNSVVDYINANLINYNDFEKEAYYYMLKNNDITGEQICVLLYDQGVLEKDSDYKKLVSGSLSAYDFMYRKIYYMQITPDMLALMPCSGSYIMTDVKTGKVKAMISYPGYDANRMNETSYYSSLLKNNSLPLYNRVTMQALAPGSTYKLVSTTAGLEEKVISKDTYIYDNVEFTKVTPTASCWNKSGHGDINVTEAIMYSCNYFFYEVGYRLATTDNGKYSDELGLSRLAKYATMYGLNEVSGLELTETKPNISDESSVRSAIGQGTNNYTAAELSRYVTALASSGNVFKLSVIDKLTDHNGKVTDSCAPVIEKKVDIKKSTWNVIHNGMYDVCNVSDYSSKMGGLGITIAGKSGTAQESELKPNHALFIGYAPYKNPEVSAVLIIPNGYGSSKILDLYADLMCTYFSVPVNRDTSKNVNTDMGIDTKQDAKDSSIRTANIPDISTQSD